MTEAVPPNLIGSHHAIFPIKISQNTIKYPFKIPYIILYIHPYTVAKARFFGRKATTALQPGQVNHHDDLDIKIKSPFI